MSRYRSDPRPTREQLDWSHFAQTAGDCDCPRCFACRRHMDTNDQPAATPAGQQTLALPGVGPVPGALYKNRRVNVYLVVVAVVTRRKTWVIVRKNGVEDELPLADLETYWQPV